MKSYKFLIPIVLILLFVYSFYFLFDTKSSTINQYNEYLSLAREYRKQDIQVDANAYYQKALETNTSIELYIEIGEFYKESKLTKESEKLGITLTEIYPKDYRSYEFLLDFYFNNGDYLECFNILNECSKRNIESDKISKVLSDIEYEYFFNGEYSDVGIFSEGLCPVFNGEKWGYVNSTGSAVTSFKFTKAGSFSGGLAPVIDNDNLSYFIDQSGNKKLVVQNVDKIEELGLIVGEIFPLFNGESWSFYNAKGEQIFGDYNEVSSTGNGIAGVEKNGRWFVVDKSGNKLTDKYYSYVASDEKSVIFRNDRLFVYETNGYILLDANMNKISDKYYKDVNIFYDNTYASVKIDDKWGFIDKDGNLVIEARYDNARSFKNGFAAVQIDGKWGFIDMDGEIVISPKFKNAKDFNESGCVFVQTSDSWELLRLYKYNF